MAEWGRSLQALGKVRFLGDGSAELATKLGLVVDIPGMGPRLQRCSLLVEDGVVKRVNVEEPRKFEVSDASTMLRQLG
jgi:peroxiredoxin